MCDTCERHRIPDDGSYTGSGLGTGLVLVAVIVVAAVIAIWTHFH